MRGVGVGQASWILILRAGKPHPFIRPSSSARIFSCPESDALPDLPFPHSTRFPPCDHRLRWFRESDCCHRPLRPVTMLRVGPGSNRRTGIDKLVASRAVEQS
jgi:hypothetical protein